MKKSCEVWSTWMCILPTWYSLSPLPGWVMTIWWLAVPAVAGQSGSLRTAVVWLWLFPIHDHERPAPAALLPKEHFLVLPSLWRTRANLIFYDKLWMEWHIRISTPSFLTTYVLKGVHGFICIYHNHCTNSYLGFGELAGVYAPALQRNLHQPPAEWVQHLWHHVPAPISWIAWAQCPTKYAELPHKPVSDSRGTISKIQGRTVDGKDQEMHLTWSTGMLKNGLPITLKLWPLLDHCRLPGKGSDLFPNLKGFSPQACHPLA